MGNEGGLVLWLSRVGIAAIIVSYFLPYLCSRTNLWNPETNRSCPVSHEKTSDFRIFGNGVFLIWWAMLLVDDSPNSSSPPRLVWTWVNPGTNGAHTIWRPKAAWRLKSKHPDTYRVGIRNDHPKSHSASGLLAVGIPKPENMERRSNDNEMFTSFVCSSTWNLMLPGSLTFWKRRKW